MAIGSPANGSPANTGRSSDPTVRWTVTARRVEQTFGDGTVQPFFRFVSADGTPAAGRLPVLEADEHQVVSLTVRNSLDFPVRPTIVGFATGPVVEPRRRVEWTFNMPDAGTWLMTDALLGLAAGSVGFGGMLISRSAAGRQGPRGSQIDREYVLLYQDADELWNLAVDAGVPPDTAAYQPNYHTVNGLTFPDTMNDPDTVVHCQVGEQVLIRLGNLGHVRQSIHLHGYHAEIISQNNQPQEILPAKDTIPLPGQSTDELLLPVLQGGVFPLHPHSLTCTTDNGTYPGGQITLINATT
jgi:FtsP/CotA-like multicopper oxidase with cupredoxin domain